MKPSRLRTLLLGLTAGVIYAFLTMLIVMAGSKSVSISYIFVLPLVLGAIPVFFSTKEQLRSYTTILIIPVLSVLTFFYLCFLSGFEGMICLVVIVGPFIILGALGAFIVRLIRLKSSSNATPLYSSLLLPFIFLLFESNFQAADHFGVVKTAIDINANRSVVWQNIKNVKNIQSSEIPPHFIHLIGIPKPLNGELNKEGVGAVRSITWEKGIKFREIINNWQEGSGFSYDIKVDPASIPPTTLDEHVMIGGKYFDILAGGYTIDSLSPNQFKVTLSCSYRVTTNLNFYSNWWAGFILNDFNEMILQVIKRRCGK
jgi:hypothetical protein